METKEVSTKQKPWLNILVLLFCFAIATAFLTICSQSSFLYSFNSNTDFNWYITVGTGLTKGKVPYKDLFEQKGPLVYYIFAFFCLFKTPKIPAFIFEIFCVGLFLFLTYKIASRYISKFSSVVVAVIIGFLACASPYNLVSGGSVEEFCLPAISYILYCFLDFIEQKKQFGVLRSLTLGLCLSFLLWVKFTTLACAIPILLIWLIINLKNKNFKTTFAAIGLMLLSFLVSTFFVLLYFIIKGALYDLFWAYFYMNLFAYNSAHMGLFVNIFKMFAYDFFCISLCLIGMFLYFNHFGKTAWLYFCVIVFNLLLLMFQNCHIHYFVELYPFAGLGLALIFKAMFNHKLNVVFKTICLALIVCLGGAYCFYLCPTTVEIGKKKESYAQFQVAEDIAKYAKQHDIANPTLLTYQLFDFGFYNAANITPNTRFFVKNVFSEEAFPEMYQQFDLYITEQRTDFVLLKKNDYYVNKNFFDEYYSYLSEYQLEQFNNLYINYSEKLVLLIKK